VLLLPALSVAEQSTACGPSDDVSTGSQLAAAIPDVLSEAPASAVAAALCRTGSGETLGLSTGAVASRLIVTDFVSEPARLVALQVNVVPDVSLVTRVVSQPDVLSAGPPPSVQLTVTSLTYQPLLPSVPVMLGVTVGGSSAGASTTKR